MKKCWAVWLAIMAVGSVVRGAMPAVFLYEGYYANDTGPFTGVVNVQIRLYTNQYASTWVHETSGQVSVVNGYYAIMVGNVRGNSNGLAHALANGEVYAEALINGQASDPRSLLVPTAFALRAGGLTAGGVTREMLATGSVQREHLGVGSVGAAQVSEEAIAGWHIQNGSVQLRDLDTADVDTRYVLRAGDNMAGGLTNQAGYWGNGFGLTNLAPETLHAATSFVRKTGDQIWGRLNVQGQMTVQTPRGASTNPALTRILMSNYATNWRTHLWAWNLGTWVPYNDVQPSALEVWEYPQDGTPACGFARFRILSADYETNVPAQVVIGSQGNVGFGCWPTNSARVQVNGVLLATAFAGDGSALTNLSPEALHAATSFVRRTGDVVGGDLEVMGTLVVSGAAQLTYVPPQGGISMGIFTNR